MHKHFNAWRCLFYGWGCALCVWKRLPYGWGCALLRMETPLRGRSGGHTGAAPTIPRVASCPKVAGEVLADGLKQEKVAGEVLADGLKREKVAGEVLADGLKREKVAGEVLADGLNQEKVAGEVLADGQKQEMIAGEVLAADIPRCLSQENSSSLHNHKGIVVARCSPLHKHKCIVAGEVLADGLIRKKVGGKGLNGGITR